VIFSLGTNQEVYRAIRRFLRTILLSSVQVNVEEDIPQKPRSGWETASFTVIRNCLKNWDATICVLAVPDAGFKKCCMQSGLFDGSRRNHFFPKIEPHPAQGNLVLPCLFLLCPLDGLLRGLYLLNRLLLHLLESTIKG
jgi:hypothetical protein